MRIAHNLMAMNTYQSLRKNNKAVGDSLEKLSSGLRIHSASNDSAGLTISEGMRAQIRGLQQAERNIQDGISLIQTAEGALGEIQDITQRMRELSIQGLNGTLTKSDRETIQSELDHLKFEIQRTSTDTQFNNKVLLDGSLEKIIDNKIARGFEWKVDINPSKLLTAIVSTMDGGMIVGGMNDRNAFPYSSASLAKYSHNGELLWELNIQKDGEYNTVYDIKQLKGKDEYILTTRSRYKNADSFDNKNIFYKVDGNGNITEKIDRGYDNYSYSINQNDDGTFVETGLEGSSLFIRTFDSNFNSTGYMTFKNHPDHPIAGMDVKKTSDDGYILVGLENQSSSKNGVILKLNANLSVVWEKMIPNDSFSSVQETKNGEFMVLGNSLYLFDSGGNVSGLNSNISYPMDTHLESNGYITRMNNGGYLINSGTRDESTLNQLYKVDETGQTIWSISIDDFKFKMNSSTQLKTGDYVALGKNEIIKYTREDYTKVDKSLYIQVGANGGQNLGINIDSMTTESLGFINGIPKIITDLDANQSVEAIDNAIEKISSARSNLGALQNRLEHSSRNNLQYEENLTAAESRIRDVDLAKEMMNQTKYSILSQAAQAMLAQANQQSKEVLELLR